MINDAILMFDSALRSFHQVQKTTVKSIYNRGAREVAIEFRSFSKTAGFTGTRCAYAVVPKEVTGKTKSGERQALNPMWNRRQCTKSMVFLTSSNAVLKQYIQKKAANKLALTLHTTKKTLASSKKVLNLSALLYTAALTLHIFG